MNYAHRASRIYKHWYKYQQDPRDKSGLCAINSKAEQEFWDFVQARMEVFWKKDQGIPYPWTEDEIISKNRFCNVYRELDRTTLELHELAQPVLHDLELSLLNFSYMRWVGLPEIISKIGLLNFSEKCLKDAWEAFDNIEGKRFTSAYNSAIAGILSTGCANRQEFIFSYVPKSIFKISQTLISSKDRSIKGLCDQIAPLFGFNAKFMTMEILMDIGYQFPDLIDEFQPVFIGPGAEPSVKLFNPNKSSDLVIQTLMKTQPIEYFSPFIVNDLPVFITAANLENDCCEFRKYCNLKNGTGQRGKTPRKRLYKV